MVGGLTYKLGGVLEVVFGCDLSQFIILVRVVGLVMVDIYE